MRAPFRSGEVPSRAGPASSTSAQHHGSSDEGKESMAREKSNVGQRMQELPLEIQIEFAERGLCTLISSKQRILLLVTNGL